MHKLTKKNKVVFVITVILICILQSMPISLANGNEYSSSYANTLNTAMLNRGVVSTSGVGDYVDITKYCPTGVLYADTVNFENHADDCLLIFRSDSASHSIYVDIYKYNAEKKGSEIITTISKPYSTTIGEIAVLSLADSGTRRYIVYTEYIGEDIVKEEYYTVINEDAFVQITAPESKNMFGVVSFNSKYLHSEVDISYYNNPLTVFFSKLKDDASQNVSYPNILDTVTREEHDRLSRVLARTSEFTHEFDIGEYSEMSAYSLAVGRHNGNGKFNAITHIYSLGDEFYYVRYSTDLCFYNGTILRRTDKAADNYQILNVRNDFIPFSDTELNNLKTAYSKNRLVLEKSQASIAPRHEPTGTENKLDFPNIFNIPEMLSPGIRRPVAIVGGTVLSALFILLWIYIKSDDKKGGDSK